MDNYLHDIIHGHIPEPWVLLFDVSHNFVGSLPGRVAVCRRAEFPFVICHNVLKSEHD